MSALTLVFLWLACVMPSGKFGFVAASSLFCAAAIEERGIPAGLAVFAVSAILAALLLAGYTAQWLYPLFFGYYPIIRKVTSRLRNKVAAHVALHAVFTAAAVAVWYTIGAFMFNFSRFGLEGGAALAVLLIGGNFVFAVFNLGYGKLLEFYRVRISRHIKR
ncbi:MAG: hypothetical protein LBN30_08370 [Oscillospiraceae bacterium]|nr:hypothetical protein [Oscillospiraceae bacterium]